MANAKSVAKSPSASKSALLAAVLIQPTSPNGEPIPDAKPIPGAMIAALIDVGRATYGDNLVELTSAISATLRIEHLASVADNLINATSDGYEIPEPLAVLRDELRAAAARVKAITGAVGTYYIVAPEVR